MLTVLKAPSFGLHFLWPFFIVQFFYIKAEWVLLWGKNTLEYLVAVLWQSHVNMEERWVGTGWRREGGRCVHGAHTGRTLQAEKTKCAPAYGCEEAYWVNHTFREAVSVKTWGWEGKKDADHEGLEGSGTGLHLDAHIRHSRVPRSQPETHGWTRCWLMDDIFWN